MKFRNVHLLVLVLLTVEDTLYDIVCLHKLLLIPSFMFSSTFHWRVYSDTSLPQTIKPVKCAQMRPLCLPALV